jgi:hypothetical protein
LLPEVNRTRPLKIGRQKSEVFVKIFLSWSGARSKAVAELLGDWLSCVIQSCRPWISTRDIDRGALWFGEIHDQLKDTSVGIVVLTQENKDRPWILFEAGALAKGLSTTRVCTLLVDLAPKDIDDPLAQFNHTTPDKDGMKNLVLTLNGVLGEQRLRDRTIAEVFETYWPQFELAFENVRETTKPSKPPPPRKNEDMLGEILDVTRSLNLRMRDLEQEQKKQGLGRIYLNERLKPSEKVSDMYFRTSKNLGSDVIVVSDDGKSFEIRGSSVKLGEPPGEKK